MYGLGRKRGDSRRFESIDIEALREYVYREGGYPNAARKLGCDESYLRKVVRGDIKSSALRDQWRKKLSLIAHEDAPGLSTDEKELVMLFRQIGSIYPPAQDTLLQEAKVLAHQSRRRAALLDEAASVERVLKRDRPTSSSSKERVAPTK